MSCPRSASDQSFGGYTAFDLGVGYDLGRFALLKKVRLALNATNLADQRYAANVDNSVFAPNDPTGTIIVFHSSTPR